MAIRHRFQSGKADGADTTVVRPSNWNDVHANPYWIAHSVWDVSSGFNITNIPAALTEQRPGLWRGHNDFTTVTEARLLATMSTAANAAAEIRAQYSTDGGTSWAYFDGASGPLVNISVGNALRIGAWVAIVAAAKVPALIRFITINGDGVADPAFVGIMLQVR